MVQVLFRTIDGAERAVDAHPGESLMQAAVRNRVAGIEAACGGSMVCGTCHVYVAAPWFTLVGPPGEMEAEMHEYGVHVEANSRLACQIKITDALDGITVTTPPSQR